jgi:polyprenyl-phospho-N-acetylgalactosaminyl synthase
VNEKPEPRILVCIPSFNESKNIVEIINKSKKYSDGMIIYDDGSMGDNYELARKAGAIVIKNPMNTGYGATIRELSKLLA